MIFSWLQKARKPAVGRVSLEVSAVVPTYNRLALLQAAIANLRRELAGVDHEIVVVDGGSTDGSIEWLARQSDILLLVQHNRGPVGQAGPPARSWGYFMNLGLNASRGRFLLMTSDDCLLVPGSLAAALRLAAATPARRRLGGVAFYYRDWPRDRRYFVRAFADGRVLVNHGLFVRAALERAGWIDETTYPFYRADTDLCLRLWHAGFRIEPCPDAYVEHFYDAADAIRAVNKESSAPSKAAFAEAWNPHYAKAALKVQRLFRDFDDPHHTAAAFPPTQNPAPASPADSQAQ